MPKMSPQLVVREHSPWKQYAIIFVLLLLVVVGELTHQEVADLLNVPLGTVLSRVSRARRRLREFLLATAER